MADCSSRVATPAATTTAQAMPPSAEPIAAAMPGRASTIENRSTRNESGPGVSDSSTHRPTKLSSSEGVTCRWDRTPRAPATRFRCAGDRG
ncbi:Uncharacterised protein [Mycobacteroides abscessus subsp. abscessus]|nr:Uncharacterised protein [Mycobacteroides abscessus subsp. abscessus]